MISYSIFCRGKRIDQLFSFDDKTMTKKEWLTMVVQMFLRICRRFFLVSLFSPLGHNTRVSPFAFAMTLKGKRELKDRATKFAVYGLPVTLRMLRVKSDKCDWFWSQIDRFHVTSSLSKIQN